MVNCFGGGTSNSFADIYHYISGLLANGPLILASFILDFHGGSYICVIKLAESGMQRRVLGAFPQPLLYRLFLNSRVFGDYRKSRIYPLMTPESYPIPFEIIQKEARVLNLIGGLVFTARLNRVCSG
jgi:hypothetical protein